MCLQHGQTALHIASIEGALDSVRTLIRAKADVNAVDPVRIKVDNYWAVLPPCKKKVNAASIPVFTECLFVGWMHPPALGCFNESYPSCKGVVAL